MKALVWTAVVVLFGLCGAAGNKVVPPKVQVYSRSPGHFGQANKLICHVSGFHPPEIAIQLLKNGKEIPNANQTDLTFEENWHYHLTRHVPFTPTKEDTFVCIVNHMNKPQAYTYESDI